MAIMITVEETLSCGLELRFNPEAPDYRTISSANVLSWVRSVGANRTTNRPGQFEVSPALLGMTVGNNRKVWPTCMCDNHPSQRAIHIYPSCIKDFFKIEKEVSKFTVVSEKIL